MPWEILIALPALFSAAGFILWRCQVDTRVTCEDMEYIGRFMREGGGFPLKQGADYPEQIRFILAVHAAVSRVIGRKDARSGVEIPPGRPREPKDLYLTKSHACFDVSRTIEKIFRANALQSRHIFIFSAPPGRSFLETIASPGASDSHAATEVLTRKGWLVVDPVHPWISLDLEGNPVSIERIRRDVGRGEIRWHRDYDPKIERSYHEPFYYVYGLYSRHGRFYPPYGWLPDINWGEALPHLKRLACRDSREETASK